MALDDDIRILSGVPFLEGFTPDALRLLAFAVDRFALPRGEALYREGDPADCAFVLTKGRIELARERNGQIDSLGPVAPGALLGEFALIAPTHRLTGAYAGTDCTLLQLDRRDFRRILQEYPDLAIRLHRRVAEDLQDMIARIERLAPRFSE